MASGFAARLPFLNAEIHREEQKLEARSTRMYCAIEIGAE